MSKNVSLLPSLATLLVLPYLSAMTTRLPVTTLLLSLVALSCTSGDLQLKEGDIVFQISQSPDNQTLQRATQSQWNHMGIILTHNGRRMVFEAAEVVKFTPINVWVKRGKGSRCIVKRLKNLDALLTPMAMEKLELMAARFEGKPHDSRFGWSDDRMYSSELVWKILQRALGVEVGSLQKLGDFHLEDAVVKARLQEHYGDAIPLNEAVISPEQMFRSELLETVYEQN